MSAENLSRPNLFSYATSELSQDAFICWLAAWADLKYKDTDPALYNVARTFVGSIIHKIDSQSGYDIADIKTVGIGRQVGKLDVLIEVNKGLPNQLAILVEDKTHTSNHSDQLNRYYDKVSRDYTPDEMIPVYFKTGYQSRFDTLGAFKPYLRSDFLKVLRAGQKAGIINAIFSDFLAHLERMEYAISQFSQMPFDKWEDDDWRGFYMVLYDNRHKISSPTLDDGADWGYVANPSGGFFGYWWYFTYLSELSYMPYLQLEQNCLTFKIIVDNENERRSARDEAHNRVMHIAPQLGLDVIRPERMGHGKFMTVARMKADYRISSGKGLDLDATLANLKKAQEVLDAAFKAA
jgi:hypothetical protein